MEMDDSRVMDGHFQPKLEIQMLREGIYYHKSCLYLTKTQMIESRHQKSKGPCTWVLKMNALWRWQKRMHVFGRHFVGLLRVKMYYTETIPNKWKRNRPSWHQCYYCVCLWGIYELLWMWQFIYLTIKGYSFKNCFFYYLPRHISFDSMFKFIFDIYTL